MTSSHAIAAFCASAVRSAAASPSAITTRSLSRGRSWLFSTPRHERAMTRNRRRILMICAHEPSLDPRIRWEAESAARHFDVTVLGFNRDDGSRPAAQAEGGYRVVHLARPAVTGLAYFWQLKDALPWGATIPLVPFVLLLAP